MNRTAVRVTAVAVVPALALAGVAGTGLAVPVITKTENVISTEIYLRARHKYDEAIKGDLPAGRVSARLFVAHVRAECQNVLAGAPPGRVTEEFSREASGEVDQALARPQRGPSIVFARKIERLRWTNRLLTYYVHGSAAETRAEAELVAPDLCTDARAMAASHY
ncbi:MAG TPA: hypothetical protein VKU89_11155 [Solirubrobacteraceae bacterium]|nr:hypothetical protein [Solirubrobacteraceae bacterium]